MIATLLVSLHLVVQLVTAARGAAQIAPRASSK